MKQQKDSSLRVSQLRAGNVNKKTMLNNFLHELSITCFNF